MVLLQWVPLPNDTAPSSAERDWERYHTPRNLMLAFTGEVHQLHNYTATRTAAYCTSLCRSTLCCGVSVLARPVQRYPHSAVLH
jgi:hypothetical protein